MNVGARRGGISGKVGFGAGLLAAAVGIVSGVSAPPPANGVDVVPARPSHAGTAQVAVSTLDSGLRGQVLYGPTCPVQRSGAICERPYQAIVVVSRTVSRGTVDRVATSAAGRFTVRLRAGRYLVKVSSHTTFPRTWSQNVTITAHHFTKLTIRIDSGIR